MKDNIRNEYYLGNVSCNGSNRIEFQSGDVIGYHQGRQVLYQLWNIMANGYISYHSDESNPLNTFSISDASSSNNVQPLIEVMYGELDKPNIHNATIENLWRIKELFMFISLNKLKILYGRSYH